MKLIAIGSALLCFGCISPGEDAVMDASSTVDRTAIDGGADLDAGRNSDVSDLARLDGRSADSDVPEASDRSASPTLDCSVQEGVAAEWTYPSGRRGSICAPLQGTIGVQTENCRPRLTTAYAAVPGPVYFYLEGDGMLFGTVRSTMAGFIVGELVPGCSGSVDEPCRYRRQDRGCEVEITHAGQSGDLVEAILRTPCRLLHDFGDGPVTEVTLTSAVVRGRLQYVGDAITGTDDGGGFRCDATP